MILASRLRSLAGLVGALALAALAGACSTLPYSDFGPTPPPVVVPDGSAERAALNETVYDTTTGYIADHYFDPEHGGLDWDARAAHYRSEAMAQPSEAGLYRVMDALIEELDDHHTNATSPSARARVEAREKGEATVSFGIGLLLTDDGYVVNRVVPDSPADEAGVRIGWRLVSINGEASTDEILADDERSDTILFVDEEGTEHTVTMVGRLLTRRPLREATARDDGVLMLRFDGFQMEDLHWLKARMDEVRADPPRAIVVDLRDNGGGRVNVLGDVVAQFFEGRTDYIIMKGRFFRTRYHTRPVDEPWTGPLAVLIGPGSASASELFAATVQDNDRGVVVGQPSAGSVIGSQHLNLPDGGELSLSMRAVFTANDVLLEKVGVTPDILVEPTWAQLRNGEDPSLEAAAEAVLR